MAKKNKKTAIVQGRDAAALYRQLRAVPLEQWPDNAELVRRFKTDSAKSGMPQFNGKFEEPEAKKLRLMGRIAQSCSEKEFTDLLNSGELPPVKLNQSEAELLKGGIAIIVGIVVIAGLLGTGALVGDAASKYETAGKIDESDAKTSDQSTKKTASNARRNNLS